MKTALKHIPRQRHKGPGRQFLLASATRLTTPALRHTQARSAKVSDRAWELRDRVPELRTGVGWLADASSRVRLYTARTTDGEGTEPEEVTDDSDVTLPLKELSDLGPGMAQQLRTMVTQLEIAGESYLVGVTVDGERRWLIASADEIRTLRGHTEVHLPEEDRWVPVRQDAEDGEAGTLIRLWNPHPRRAFDAESPVCALQDVLDQIIALTGAITATANSRLAGPGVLKVPDNAVVLGPAGENGTPQYSQDLAGQLNDILIAPVGDRSSAASVVPVILSADPDTLAGIERVDFQSAFDTSVPELLERAQRRLAIGLSLPPAMLLGLDETQHWTSFAIKDEAIQVGVAPRVEMICDALTMQFLRPMLRAMGVENPEQYRIWYSLAALAQKPDRSKEGTEAYDRRAISARAYRKSVGLREDDAPTPAETAERMRIDLAYAAPEQAGSLWPQLGPAGEEEASAAETEPDGAQEAPEVSVRPEENEPAPGPPREAETASAWRTAALDGVARTLLAHAGQALLRRQSPAERTRLKDMDLTAVHTRVLVTEAWADSLISTEPAYMTAALEATDPGVTGRVGLYVRQLLVSGTAHDTDVMARVLTPGDMDGLEEHGHGGSGGLEIMEDEMQLEAAGAR